MKPQRSAYHRCRVKNEAQTVLIVFQDGLVETLRRTRVKFVHCFLPQHNAGCTDNKSLLSVKSNQNEDSVINVPLLRSQVHMRRVHVSEDY